MPASSTPTEPHHMITLQASFRAEHNSPLFQQNYCSLSGVPPSIHLKVAGSLVPSLHLIATLALFSQHFLKHK